MFCVPFEITLKWLSGTSHCGLLLSCWSKKRALMISVLNSIVATIVSLGVGQLWLPVFDCRLTKDCNKPIHASKSMCLRHNSRLKSPELSSLEQFILRWKLICQSKHGAKLQDWVYLESGWMTFFKYVVLLCVKTSVHTCKKSQKYTRSFVQMIDPDTVVNLGRRDSTGCPKLFFRSFV